MRKRKHGLPTTPARCKARRLFSCRGNFPSIVCCWLAYATFEETPKGRKYGCCHTLATVSIDRRTGVLCVVLPGTGRDFCGDGVNAPLHSPMGVEYLPHFAGSVRPFGPYRAASSAAKMPQTYLAGMCYAVFSERIFVQTRHCPQRILEGLSRAITKYGRKSARKNRQGFDSRRTKEQTWLFTRCFAVWC